MTKVNIEGVDVNMEIDTGSGKTLISHKEYQDDRKQTRNKLKAFQSTKDAEISNQKRSGII